MSLYFVLPAIGLYLIWTGISAMAAARQTPATTEPDPREKPAEAAGWIVVVILIGALAVAFTLKDQSAPSAQGTPLARPETTGIQHRVAK